MPVVIVRRRTWPASAALLAGAALAACVTLLVSAAEASGSAASPAGVAPGTITTIAGGVGGPGPATTVALGQPCALSMAHGRLYIDASPVVIREVSERTGFLTTPIGSGLPGVSPNGTPGPLTAASVSCGLAADSAGNVIWSDKSANRVRMTAARSGTFYGQAVSAGRTYTIAGDGRSGFGGGGEPATGTALSQPAGIAVDRHGNLVFAASDRILVLAARTGEYYRQAMTAGDIYVIAGGGTSQGNGVPATSVALGLASFGTVGVRVDPRGNVVFSDPDANIVQVVAVTSGRFYGRPMTAGDIYAIAGDGTRGDTGNGGPAARAELRAPQQLTIDHAGNVIFSEKSRVRIVAERSGLFYGRSMRAGDIYELLRSSEMSVAVDDAGNLVIGSAHRASDSWIRVLGNRTGSDFGKRIVAGQLTTVAGNGQFWTSGNGGPAVRAQFVPAALAADGSAGLAVAAGPFDGTLAFMALQPGEFFGRRMIASNIYTVAGTGQAGCRKVSTGPGLRSGVEPDGLAFDSQGNLIIADLCRLIRVLAMRSGTFYGRHMVAGDIYTIAGGGTKAADGTAALQVRLLFPSGVAVDGSGNILIADAAAARVEVLATTTGTFYDQAMQAGHVYTIAGTGSGPSGGDGGPAIDAAVNPGGITVDGSGDVLVTERDSDAIRLIAEHTGTPFSQPVTAGDIYTIAGAGTSELNGIPAISATLNPSSVQVDAAGNLLIGDPTRLRVVAAATGIFYGQSMTAGDIYTIAGKRLLPGFSGDDGPAVQAHLDAVESIALVPGSGIAIADGSRIRLVSG
jgi:hypothetical protein